jgi:GNAT superfamily N-acetyltransferase
MVPASVLAEGFPVGAAESPVFVRQAVSTDRDPLTAMFARCTLETRYRRFHGPVKAIPGRYLAEALSATPFHYALVACLGLSREAVDQAAAPDLAAQPVEIVALASCRLIDEGAAELGVLIEDAWQRQGLGTRLVNDLVAYASGTGLRVLAAQLLAEQAWIAGLLRPHGTCSIRPTWGGILNVTVRLDTGSA